MDLSAKRPPAAARRLPKVGRTVPSPPFAREHAPHGAVKTPRPTHVQLPAQAAAYSSRSGVLSPPQSCASVRDTAPYLPGLGTLQINSGLSVLKSCKQKAPSVFPEGAFVFSHRIRTCR